MQWKRQFPVALSRRSVSLFPYLPLAVELRVARSLASFREETQAGKCSSSLDSVGCSPTFDGLIANAFRRAVNIADRVYPFQKPLRLKSRGFGLFRAANLPTFHARRAIPRRIWELMFEVRYLRSLMLLWVQVRAWIFDAGRWWYFL